MPFSHTSVSSFNVGSEECFAVWMISAPWVANASSPPIPEIEVTDSDLPECAKVDDSFERSIFITNDCDFKITLIQYLEDTSLEDDTIEFILEAGRSISFRPDPYDGVIWEVITWKSEENGQGQIELHVRYVVSPCPTSMDCLNGCQLQSNPNLDPLFLFGSIGLFIFTLRHRRRKM